MMLTCVVGLDVVATGHGLSPWALGVIGLVCALTVAAIAMHLWQGPNGSPSEARLSASLPAPIHRADPLTRLPDRTTFLGELARVIAARRLGGPDFALAIIDLDHFRNVNDVHGHAVGDTVLIETARRLTSYAGAGFTIARLGGDEFGLLLEAEETSARMKRVADSLIETLASPISIPQGLLRVGASIGVATSAFENANSEDLMRAADLALAEAKRSRRGSIRFFESGMDQALKLRSTLEADLRRAISAGEIVPFYQPLIALDDGRLTGFEVLARWQHPQYGIIPPASFIPLAEELGRVGDLFYKLLERACADAHDWPTQLSLSVNVSPTQFAEPQLAARILAILRERGIDPARLELEITENALVDEVSSARESLVALREAGVAVALDDFGTGYSSLRHLSDLPIDRLKIDRLFVEGAQQNIDKWRIVRAIVQLAHALDLETTAEGIEISDVADILRDVGCDIGQGFLFGKPKPADATAAWLHELRRTPSGVMPRLAV
ncbi:MAG: EAL domain-containing protein [Rhizobiales bacterium]|nr:EAL domain-containing protein [Hyphomicrobiales bacterium]